MAYILLPMDISVSVPTIRKVTILLVRKTGVPRLLLVQQRARYIRNNPLLLRSRCRWKYYFSAKKTGNQNSWKAQMAYIFLPNDVSVSVPGIFLV